MTPKRLAHYIVALALASAFPAPADSIVVDGTLYRDVYIGAGAKMYYIQNPADGTMIQVAKDLVRERDIHITQDRDERRQLRDRWKLKRMNKDTVAVATPKYDGWREEIRTTLPAPRSDAVALQEPAPLSTHAKPVVLTNITKRRPSLSGRKVFMNTEGVAIITNTPEEFRGRDEYVEVVLHYEPIDVPDKFKHALDVSGPAGGAVEDIVAHYATRYGIDPHVIYAVIKSESNGRQYAVSGAGARGLMQLMPGTAVEMGVDDIFDPVQNIAGGTQYLSKLMKLFDGNLTLALAGYNAGPGNVKKYGGVPPFKETQDYVRQVQRLARFYKRSGAPQFRLASDTPVERGYLPPESHEYYQIVLENGLTVPAEEVYLDNARYIYVFKGRSSHLAERQVRVVYEPS